MAVSPPPEAPPTRLLVVEDDDTIRETIAEALSSEGFEVDAVASGSTALERFKGSPENPSCDLVLLDLMLPGVSGLDVCRYVRRRGFSTPIIVLSARQRNRSGGGPGNWSRRLSGEAVWHARAGGPLPRAAAPQCSQWR